MSLLEALQQMIPDVIELTDEVIETLVLQGWEKKELLLFQRMDYLYSPMRNSVISPPRWFGALEGDR